PGSFIAGVDLEEMRGVATAAEGAAHARRGQQVLRRLELLPVPTFALIEGACLGAGAELALACAYRLASLAPQTRIAFPEVQLGILPALGGTVRLPRLIGVREALELILSGREVGAEEAGALGIVDAAFPSERFEEETRRFVVERIRRGRLRTGARRGVGRRLLEDTAPGRRVIFARLRREAERRKGAPSAARRVLETVADGIALPLDRAFEREAEALGELIVTREARGLLHAFRLRQAAGSGREPSPPPAPRVERAAVLGAGRTGTGIAYLLAAHEIPVRVRDLRHQTLTGGIERLHALFTEAVREKRLDRREAAARAGTIAGTLGFGGFGTVDVVLEAVRDEEELKRSVLREVEEHVREDCILVSTTGMVPISRLQPAVERPERVVGMHFLPPVAWAPLVEVVRGENTAEETLAAAVALARRLGKTALVVGDGPGFLANRILAAYLGEALRLLEEGVPVERVDGAMTEFGMPMGPLRLADELGIGRVARLSEFLAAELGERFRPSPVLRLVAGGPRLKREPEPGFYRYGEGREPVVSPRVAEALRGAAREGESGGEEMQSRMVLAMVNEAARALEDGIVGTAAEVDLAMLLAVGFPAFRGGLLYHADRRGLPQVAETLEEHAAKSGERFSPAPRLRRLAESGRGFYDAPERVSPPGPEPASGHAESGAL
ncbi:MAG TPA: 3-hydroxyacyl-CoA dehydrogenase NAD-binding domain-containing protein, partial [Longimicrobiaceae bacterium]|nr:3-hydroxyacyl-CoA dehydrogenase NAD-binding domain-containing protein [Longimicrobiaceae bacterium]